MSKLEPMNLDKMLTMSDLRSTATNSYHTTQESFGTFDTNRMNESVSKRRTTVKKPGFILKNRNDMSTSNQVLDYDMDD